MLYRILTLIRKELLSYLRDPQTRGIIIGPPLVQLVVFSFAVTLDVENVDVAILNEDTGYWSQELISRISSSQFVDELISVKNMEEIKEKIDLREILIGIQFKSDFSRQIVDQKTADVQIILDGRRANSGQVAFNYINNIAATLGMDIDKRTTSHSPQPVIRHWFNPNLNYQWFVLPSLSAILAMLISLIITSLSIARERELGTFDQLLVSPMSPTEIIIGKTISPMLIGAFLSSLMIAAGIFIFGVPFFGNLFLLFISMLLFILSIVGVGLSISSICQTQQQAILGAFMCTVPVILTSGFATPVENMPDWLQTAAEANPLKHFLIIVQGSFLKAPPIDVVALNAMPLILIAFVSLIAAIYFVRGKLQ